MKKPEAKVSKIVNRNEMKCSVKIGKGDPYSVNSISIDGKKPISIDDEAELRIPSGSSISVFSQKNSQKIKEEFGVTLPPAKSNVPVKEKVIEAHEPEMSKEPETFVGKYVSECYQYFDDRGALHVLFLLNPKKLLKTVSIIPRYAKNLNLESEFKITELLILRDRVLLSEIPFDQNVAPEKVETSLSEILSDGDWSVYEFVDKNAGRLTYGKFQYTLFLTFKDQFVSQIVDLLEELKNLISSLDSSQIKASNWERQSIDMGQALEVFKKAEKIHYGKNTMIEVESLEDYWIFLRKLRELYFQMYGYTHSFSLANDMLSISKKFKELFNADSISSEATKYPSIKSLADYSSWKANVIMLAKAKKEDVLSGFGSYNLQADQGASDYLKSLKKPKGRAPFIEIMQIGGDTIKWVPLDSLIRKLPIEKKPHFLARFAGDASLGQYFLIENSSEEAIERSAVRPKEEPPSKIEIKEPPASSKKTKYDFKIERNDDGTIKGIKVDKENK